MELFEDPEVLNAQQKMKELVSVVCIKESLKTIVKASPKKFFFIFFLIILPFSFLQFLLVTNNLQLAICIADLSYKSSPESLLPYKQIVRTCSSANVFLKLNSIHYYGVCVILFFTFYLLSISATTVTVASHYLSKPLSAVPRILKRLAITFLHALPLIFLHYTAYLVVFTLFCIILTLIRTIPKINYVLVSVIGIILLTIYFFFFLVVHGRFIAWWNFANFVSVLEPNIYGSGAIKMSKQKIITSLLLILNIYMGIVFEIVCIANWVMNKDMDIIVRVLICSLSVMALAAVNFSVLTAQNLMYYQDQVIDRGVLNVCVLEMKGFVGNDDNRVKGDHLEV